jgi:hypothetical protein
MRVPLNTADPASTSGELGYCLASFGQLLETGSDGPGRRPRVHHDRIRADGDWSRPAK